MGSDTGRVLVTGAAGFVGLNVVEHLLTDGIEVVAVDGTTLPTAAKITFATLPGSLHEVVADVTDPDAVADAVAGADLVIHGAAITAGADRERREARRIVEVNVVGTQIILDAATASGTVRRVIYVSSGAVYGDQAHGLRTIDEETPPDPVSLYAITKLAGERLVRRHAALHKTDAVVARLSAVFGPWERETGVRDSLSPMYLLAQAAKRGAHVITSEYAPRNWLYARDAAAALVGLALTAQLTHDLYNITPTDWFEPGQWAGHLGIDFATEVADRNTPAVKLPGDIGLKGQRAPVANNRIRGALSDWPAFSPEDAFRDYANWLDAHDALD